MLPIERIPYCEQRLVLTEHLVAVAKAVGAFFFDSEWDSLQETYIACHLWMAHLQGTPATAYRLAKNTGMPRSTLERKLAHLVRIGYAQRHGRHYYVADHIAGNPQCAKRLTEMLHEVVDRLDKLPPVP